MPPAKFSNIHAVLGTDEAKIKTVARALATKLMPPDADEFGLEVIDGQVETVDDGTARLNQAIEALLTLPFFGGKLVWLKNVTFLDDSVAGRSESVLGAAEALIETLKRGLPDNVTCLISAIDLDKRRSFAKNLAQLAQVQTFDKIDTGRGNWEEQIEALILGEARARNLRFDRDALELFVQLVGADTGQIANELEKLDLYLVDNRTVQVDHVRSLVAQTKAGVIFDLGNALARRDLRGSLRLIDQLLRQGENAVGILLVAIIPTMRNLLVAKDLLVRHKLRPPEQPFFFGKSLERLPAQAVRHLPRKKDGSVNAYSLGIAAQSAGKYTLPELTKALEICLDAHRQSVTSQLDASFVLGQTVIRICTPASET